MSQEPTQTRQPGIERRRHERIPIRFPVEVSAGTVKCRGVTVNLSASGVLAALPVALPLGEETALLLLLPDGGPGLAMKALPLRVENGNAGPPYRIAFHFMLPAGDDLRRVRSLIYGG